MPVGKQAMPGFRLVPMRDRPAKTAHGFSYLIMLFALFLFGLGLAAIGQSWSRASQREREAELIEIGNAYARAIASYYQRSPGASKVYPRRLQDLLEDSRFVGTERHLRQIYRDPITQTNDWGLVRAADGGIMGVYSLSQKTTLHQQVWYLPNTTLPAASIYSGWKFMARVTP